MFFSQALLTVLYFRPVCLTEYKKYKKGSTTDRESKPEKIPDGKVVCCCLKDNCFDGWTEDDIKKIDAKIDAKIDKKGGSGASRAMAGVLMMVGVLMKTLF